MDENSLYMFVNVYYANQESHNSIAVEDAETANQYHLNVIIGLVVLTMQMGLRERVSHEKFHIVL